MISILDKKAIWMRDANCMNDYSELQHGFECIAYAYNGERGEGFRTVIDSIYPDLSLEIERMFNLWQPHLKQDTYIFCLSEHGIKESTKIQNVQDLPDPEDRLGRLSMWRAYGKGNGVALVLNNKVFIEPTDAIPIYTSPVEYLEKEEFSDKFHAFSERIQLNIDFIRNVPRDEFLNWLLWKFIFAAVCTKHPGFWEEREWRIVYCPSLQSSDRIVKEIKALGGVPQCIHKVELQDYPDEGFTGVEPNKLIDRIIVGPTEYPTAARRAFEEALRKAGVEDAAKRIKISEIPVRI